MEIKEKMILEKPISLKGQLFDYIKSRRNTSQVFRAQDKESYLRVGPAETIDSEVRFHRRLLEFGFPVPKILEEGVQENNEKYFLESSAGAKHFGELFQSDMQEHRVISNETFDQFLAVIKQYVEAQKRMVIEDRNWESVFIGAHFDIMLEEMPDEKEKIMAVWEKVKLDLADTPFTLCHGDFNAFNILPGGVIDFETSFEGPLGYDLVSAASSINWFPQSGDFEVLAKYSFADSQFNRLLAVSEDSTKNFDALFVLRAMWAVVRMHRFPKLQAWRYTKCKEMMNRYLANASLLDWSR